jgi:hypothetical protein
LLIYKAAYKATPTFDKPKIIGIESAFPFLFFIFFFSALCIFPLWIQMISSQIGGSASGRDYSTKGANSHPLQVSGNVKLLSVGNIINPLKEPL